jgi:Resolvase, N terminal domain
MRPRYSRAAERNHRALRVERRGRGQANRLTVHILAAVAEHEREMIVNRTKAALAAAKARGKRLGWANPARGEEQARASQNGATATKEHANRVAVNVLPIVREIRAAGIATLDGIASALNARGVRTARGGVWYPATVCGTYSLVRPPAKAYSITSSAAMRSVGGTVMPSAFAVLRLRTSSNLDNCTTGNSAGVSPFKMRPA